MSWKIRLTCFRASSDITGGVGCLTRPSSCKQSQVIMETISTFRAKGQIQRMRAGSLKPARRCLLGAWVRSQTLNPLCISVNTALPLASSAQLHRSSIQERSVDQRIADIIRFLRTVKCKGSAFANSPIITLASPRSSFTSRMWSPTRTTREGSSQLPFHASTRPSPTAFTSSVPSSAGEMPRPSSSPPEPSTSTMNSSGPSSTPSSSMRNKSPNAL
mmetsp:Transcript_85807/g.243301  ORF Transcript_85807/g.243301 Transcript_85807/m.243301 type:complete len:217 (-) Transcript_85807:242-892(-)